MPGWLVLVLWVVYAILFFVSYHKIFNVVYFNLGRGCLTEIIYILLGSMILVALWKSYWVIALIVTALLLFITFGVESK